MSWYPYTLKNKDTCSSTIAIECEPELEFPQHNIYNIQTLFAALNSMLYEIVHGIQSMQLVNHDEYNNNNNDNRTLFLLQ